MRIEMYVVMMDGEGCSNFVGEGFWGVVRMKRKVFLYVFW